MRILTKDSLHALHSDAIKSIRNRSHLNLHSDYSEKVQRLLISLVKDSYVPPHYHSEAHQWEMFVILEGIIEVTVFNENGSVHSNFLVGEKQECQIVEFYPNEIHSITCISDNALLLEIKEGPFNPKFAKKYPNWLNDDMQK
ncbi:WbuC family cupin fold metalloprotein [Providencia rustigianii]|uniref:WbuC family cupin fold metalloprotein n=1 Tax=Providencia rustigianii TaxID=158850 RepID=UPI000D8EEFF9|nr:WbuC family cupin fold metalloprotein [Providencia rustigianii]SPY79336.1 Uncharacterised protein [Providencia rustigianii]